MDKESLELLISIQDNINKGFKQLNERLDKVEFQTNKIYERLTVLENQTNDEVVSILRQMDKKINNIKVNDEVIFLKDKVFSLEKKFSF